MRPQVSSQRLGRSNAVEIQVEDVARMDTMRKDEKAMTLSEEEAEIGHSPVLAWYYYATADTNRNLAASCALLSRTVRDQIPR